MSCRWNTVLSIPPYTDWRSRLDASFWGTSENNRKAKYYRLTPAGRKQLSVQTRVGAGGAAIGRVLKPATDER